jgi:D-alanyl-D-alanine carboxypeptidase
MVKSGFVRSGFATFAAVFLAFATVVAFSATVQAAQYSSIVIDAQTGQVVSEFNADSPNYPASLTKMMTLYLTFEALEHHAISLDTVFRSRRMPQPRNRPSSTLSPGNRSRSTT